MDFDATTADRPGPRRRAEFPTVLALLATPRSLPFARRRREKRRAASLIDPTLQACLTIRAGSSH